MTAAVAPEVKTKTRVKRTESTADEGTSGMGTRRTLATATSRRLVKAGLDVEGDGKTGRRQTMATLSFPGVPMSPCASRRRNAELHVEEVLARVLSRRARMRVAVRRIPTATPTARRATTLTHGTATIQRSQTRGDI